VTSLLGLEGLFPQTSRALVNVKTGLVREGPAVRALGDRIEVKGVDNLLGLAKVAI